MKSLNPEQYPSTNSYKLYSSDKDSRLHVQEKGKEMASNVNYLNRKAKNYSKQLNLTQQNLSNLYSKRLNQYNQSIKKNQVQKHRQQKLIEMKNITTLNRYLHTLKRQQNIREMISERQKSARSVKQSHRQSQQSIKHFKDQQLRRLKSRNKALAQVSKLKNQWSKQQSYLQKRKLSATVHGSLRQKQTILTERELQRIKNLSKKQQQLLNIVEKTRKEKQKYQSEIEKIKDLKNQQLYSQIKNKSKKKKDKMTLCF